MERHKAKDVLEAILSWKDWLPFGDERLWQGYGAPFLDDWQMSGDLDKNKTKMNFKQDRSAKKKTKVIR